jgi:hypothetical protein
MFIKQEWYMRECRDLKSERLEEQNLAGCGLKQVNSPDDLVNVHQCIVYDYGKLISKDAI